MAIDYIPENIRSAELRSSFLGVIFLSIFSFAAFSVLLGLAVAFGYDWQEMLREGPISDLGVFIILLPTAFLWTTVLYRRHFTSIEILSAALPTLIAIDDFFMLHERFHSIEIVFYAGYAIAGLTLIAVQLLRAFGESYLLLGALAFLGAAMCLDFIEFSPGGPKVLGITLWGARQLAEDLLKFIGYILFAAHLFFCAKSLVSNS